MLKESTKNIENVEIDTFDGLLVDYAKNSNAAANFTWNESRSQILNMNSSLP
jgi:Phosphopantetheine adenylyltransferase